MARAAVGKGVNSVDDYIARETRWRSELQALRRLLRATKLEETVKWGAPCYTLNGQNVVGMAAFKTYFGLWFYQGALLKDPAGVLINAQEGATKALRQWRMTAAEEIDEALIGTYAEEAIALAEAGRRVAPQTEKQLVMPEELALALTGDAAASAAFAKLTPGRQREYADHVATAKRAETRARRMEKILPMILAGRGLNDKYR